MTFFGQNFKEKMAFFINFSHLECVFFSEWKIIEKSGLPGFDYNKISEKYGVSKPFHEIFIDSLPVRYASNAKAWMTSEIFLNSKMNGIGN